jgi:hypothetical protein
MHAVMWNIKILCEEHDVEVIDAAQRWVMFHSGIKSE